MRIDDFIDVGLVDVGVPSALRIDHDDRPFFAAVEATRLVDADLAWPREAQLLHALFRVLLHRFGAAVRAARTIARVAPVQAKKYVMFKKRGHDELTTQNWATDSARQAT